MAYVSYSQGFKSGGFDMRGNERHVPGTRNGYDSETARQLRSGREVHAFDGRLYCTAPSSTRRTKMCR